MLTQDHAAALLSEKTDEKAELQRKLDELLKENDAFKKENEQYKTNYQNLQTERDKALHDAVDATRKHENYIKRQRGSKKKTDAVPHNAHVNFTVPHRDRATNVVLQAYLSGFRFSVSSRLSKLA